MRTFEIFKINQLLFIEAGIILSSLLILGVLKPFFGVVYPLISISIYLIYCFMDATLKKKEEEFEDFVQVFADIDFPTASRILLTSVVVISANSLVIIFYNQSLPNHFLCSYFCTLFSSLLGFFAYIFDNKKIRKFTSLFVFTIFSTPIALITLGVGAIAILPIFYIYLDKRA
jgi:hypothetical protein